MRFTSWDVLYCKSTISIRWFRVWLVRWPLMWSLLSWIIHSLHFLTGEENRSILSMLYYKCAEYLNIMSNQHENKQYLQFYTKYTFRKSWIKCEPCCFLKLPSLFAAWLFWTFHTNHIIWKHWSFEVIHDHHFSHLLVYMKKKNFCGSLCVLLEYLLEKKTPPRLPMQITWPWPPVGIFSHSLITVGQKKMWT